MESGLSLAQVAGGELTRAAIHLIETGRSRPSMPTLQLIASKTGKPLAYFLADKVQLPSQPAALDPRVSELERLVVTGDFTGAIALAQPLLEVSLEPAVEAQLKLLLGQALGKVHQPTEALPHLRRARTLFEQLGDRWGYVDALDWEAGCLYLLEDPQALPAAEEALRLCNELDPLHAPLKARILGHIGNMHVLRKEWGKAIRCFDSAIELGGSLQDLGRLARMYTGLSVAYQETGNLAKAAACAQRAISLHAVDRDRWQIGMAENNLGLVLLKQGDYAAAEQHLNSSLQIYTEANQERGRSHVLLSLGELYLGRGELERAESFFDQAVALAERLREHLTLALAHQFLGKLAAQRADDEAADTEFWLALELLTGERAAERLVECHAVYAQVLEDRGDTKTANQHWKEALAASRPGLVRPLSLDSELIARAN
jgi:tetratricopeptide (TPR) repeat protein